MDERAHTERQRHQAIVNYVRSPEGRRLRAWLRTNRDKQAAQALCRACESAVPAPGKARLEPASVLRRLSAAWHL